MAQAAKIMCALAVPATAAAIEPNAVHLTNRMTSTYPNGDVIVSDSNLTQERTTFYESP